MKEGRPRRRWMRGSSFCLLVFLALVIVGSWVKSYWRVDLFEFESSMTAGSVLELADAPGHAVIIRRSLGLYRPSVLHTTIQPANIYMSEPWRYAGFRYHRYYHKLGVDEIIWIPHWFLLLLSLGGAWLTRPWAKRRSIARGFEVIRNL